MNSDKPLTKEKILSVRDLRVYFDIRREGAWPWQKPLVLKAVDGINLNVYAGETLGVVGESGCGKSTLARALIGMLPARTGSVIWLGQDLTKMGKKQLRSKRQELQMIFQDPLASLNPRMNIGDIIA
jgi:oligopeptide transport system ATP-binding protein